MTADVSATGLSFKSAGAHRLRAGDRVEVRLLALIDGRKDQDSMILSTHATMVRASDHAGAVVFDAPLRY